MSAHPGGLTKLTVVVEGDRAAIAEMVMSANEDPDEKPWELIMKRIRKGRSKDANAYAWLLIDKLAARLRLDKAEIYRNVIREIPGVSEIVCVRTEAADELVRIWEARGLGWQTSKIPSKLEGCINLVLYYGSSVYSTDQMSALIDELVRECREQRIETMSPDELSRLEGYRDTRSEDAAKTLDSSRYAAEMVPAKTQIDGWNTQESEALGAGCIRKEAGKWS